ncbi:tipE homolog 2 phospholipid transfer protein [Arctopsyche grandis]|uniref:tipE homolog 2 phospholipid transfer protein n=1 Tax=Arctopsyche grandis TaxID=121162 RepID=UPI00406D697A
MDSDESTIIMGADGGEEEEEEEEEEEDTGPHPPAPPTPAEQLAALLEKAKFYTSLCLGTSAILAVFGFLFLIPFVVEPAIATIIADFEAEPVTCAVTEHVYAEGLKNCSWASCREGCTSAHTRCYQILVNYTRTPFAEFERSGDSISTLEWDVTETRYLVNTEGCGYPPRVNCTLFAMQYRVLYEAGRAFPCHYSKTKPTKVVARYSWPATLQHLAIALAAPPVIFAVAVGVLAYWHCSCCANAPTHDDKLLCDELNLDEPDDGLYCRGRSGSRDTDALWKG